MEKMALQREALADREVMIYCCADGTLTYAPHGVHALKPIPQALPVLTVDTFEEAERLILKVGSLTYIENDPYKAKAGAGPSRRYRYSLPDFTFNDHTTLINVTATLHALQQGGGREVFEAAHARAREMAA